MLGPPEPERLRCTYPREEQPLRALDSTGASRPPVRLLLSGDEEIGSPASRPVIEQEALGCRACLVLEASAAGGKVKVARKGAADFDITATGTGATPDSNQKQAPPPSTRSPKSSSQPQNSPIHDAAPTGGVAAPVTSRVAGF